MDINARAQEIAQATRQQVERAAEAERKACVAAERWAEESRRLSALLDTYLRWFIVNDIAPSYMMPTTRAQRRKGIQGRVWSDSYSTHDLGEDWPVWRYELHDDGIVLSSGIDIAFLEEIIAAKVAQTGIPWPQ